MVDSKQAPLDSAAAAKALRSQLRWLLNRLLKLLWNMACVRLKYSLKDRVLVVKQLSVHCRLQVSKLTPLKTLLRFRTTAAVLRNAEEYKDYPFAYHFGAARRRRRTFG